MKKLIFIFCIFLISFSNNIWAQDVHIDNQTPCYYVVGLYDNCSGSCDNNTYDSPSNSVRDYALSIAGIGVAGDVKRICICDGSGASCVIDISGSSPCSPASPIVTCTTIICDLLPLKVNWWISGNDLYIEFTI